MRTISRILTYLLAIAGVGGLALWPFLLIGNVMSLAAIGVVDWNAEPLRSICGLAFMLIST